MSEPSEGIMKRCTKCQIEKPEEAFAMQPSRGRRRSECRECKAKADKAWLEKRRQNPPERKQGVKKCNLCKEIKPTSEFSPGNPGYFQPRCKDCARAIDQQKREEQRKNNPEGRFYRPWVNEEGVTIKRCSQCHTEMSIDQFRKKGKGYRSLCDDCEKKDSKARYDANPEKYRTKSSEFARNHPEETKARHKRWASANKERLRQYKRNQRTANPEKYLAYYLARKSRLTYETYHRWYMNRRQENLEYRRINSERFREYRHNWRKANPDKHAESQNRRRARKHNSPEIEKIDRRTIIERDKWTCYLCGQICTPKNVTLDHVVPLFLGGTHTADNLRVACRSCNCSKGAKPLDDFLNFKWESAS